MNDKKENKRSFAQVGDGNRTKKEQMEAVKAKRKYNGQSTDKKDIMKELDGEIDIECKPVVNLIDLQYKAIKKTEVAIKETNDLLEKIHKDGDAYIKHEKRRKVLIRNAKELSNALIKGER